MGGATRGGTAEPTSRDQNKRREREQGNGSETKSHKQEENLGAQTEAARQSRAAPRATERKEESSTCAWTGDTVATHNVRTMVVDGTHGVGRALNDLSVYDRMNYVVVPRPLSFLCRMPQPRHRMLVINMHFGRPWTKLWKKYVDTNSCLC